MPPSSTPSASAPPLPGAAAHSQRRRRPYRPCRRRPCAGAHAAADGASPCRQTGRLRLRGDQAGRQNGAAASGAIANSRGPRGRRRALSLDRDEALSAASSRFIGVSSSATAEGASGSRCGLPASTAGGRERRGEQAAGRRERESPQQGLHWGTFWSRGFKPFLVRKLRGRLGPNLLAIRWLQAGFRVRRWQARRKTAASRADRRPDTRHVIWTPCITTLFADDSTEFRSTNPRPRRRLANRGSPAQATGHGTVAAHRVAATDEVPPPCATFPEPVCPTCGTTHLADRDELCPRSTTDRQIVLDLIVRRPSADPMAAGIPAA